MLAIDKSKIINFAKDYMSSEKLNTIGEFNTKRHKLLSSLSKNKEAKDLAAAAIDTSGIVSRVVKYKTKRHE